MRHFRTILIALSILTSIGLLTLFPGDASIKWLGYQVDFPMALMWVAVGLVIVATISIIRLWDALIHMPQRMQDFLTKRRTHKAEQVLLEGLTALAARQLDEAKSCVAFAQKLIPNHPLTAYVAAQSANLAHDDEQARTSFMAMTQHPSVSFLGYRGLIKQAQSSQDWMRVHSLLQTVFEDRPDSPWVVENILQNSLYLAAESLLTTDVQSLLKNVYRSLPKRESRHHEALILWLQAQLVRGDERQNLLHQAHERDNQLPYITSALAEELIQNGDLKQARKVLKKSASTYPHRLFYETWRKANKENNPVLFYASLEKELSNTSDTTEAHWLLLKAAIEANMWGEAEKHGHNLLESGDDREVCLAMANMHACMNGPSDQQATSWQARALNAKWTYFWTCHTCSAGVVDWNPICPSCHSTDSLEWKRTILKNVLQPTHHSSNIVHAYLLD